MSFIDLGIFIIVGLAALVGLWKGFGTSLIKLVCFSVAVLVCFLISDYCLKFLLGVDAIKQLVLGSTFSIRTLIGSAIDTEATGVVKSLYAPLMERYAAIGGIAEWGATNEEFLSIVLSLHMFTIFMTILLYFALRIVASIIGYVLKIIFIHDTPKLASRLGGLAVGAVKGLAMVLLIMFITSFIYPFSFSKVVTNQFDNSKVALAVCEVEFKVLSKNLYSDNTIKLMLNGAGFTASSAESETPGV